MPIGQLNTFRRTATIRCRLSIVDEDGDPADPVTSMLITIWNSAGMAVVNALAMSQDIPAVVGSWYYDYTSAADAVLGQYYVQYEATSGTLVSIRCDEFRLAGDCNT